MIGWIQITFQILYQNWRGRMSEESDFSDDTPLNWIQWFCSLDDHQFLCEINEEFIRQPFHLYGLKKKVKHFEQACEMILRPRAPHQTQIERPQFLQIHQEATELYGLIHARYITTPEGLAIMREKYLDGKFGVCPRVLCQKQNVIPIGLSEDSKIARVKIYCPRCKDIYNPKKKFADVDGSFFGSSFPHLLLMTYTDLKAEFPKTEYVPKVFGFQFQQQQECQQKMIMKEQDTQQLDQFNQRKAGKSEIGTSAETKSRKNKKKKK